jgi:hypothetical protein
MPFSLHLSGEPAPLKEPVELEHHSNASLKSGDFLLGSKRGAINSELSRPAGQEATRLNKGDGAPPGSYFYEKGTRAEHQIAARKHTYILKGEKSIATLETSPEFQNAFKSTYQKAINDGNNQTDAQHIAINAAEHAVQNTGYDGYRSSRYPGTVFLFGDHQIFKPGEDPDEPELTPHPNLPKDFLPPAAEAATPPQPATQTSAVSPRRAISAPKKPGSAKTGPVSPTKPPMTPPTQVSVGASGESAASLEAINRLQSEKNRGIGRFRIDTRSGQETPLIGVDAIDARPGKFDVIIERSKNGQLILDSGPQARPLKSKGKSA